MVIAMGRRASGVDDLHAKLREDNPSFPRAFAGVQPAIFAAAFEKCLLIGRFPTRARKQTPRSPQGLFARAGRKSGSGTDNAAARVAAEKRRAQEAMEMLERNKGYRFVDDDDNVTSPVGKKSK